ncbi:MAG: hypothetical protein PHQ43_00535 [Dehalococcoidales bacterium]|nr:hypothetical protein [Dehalococcoidales bacterium]
MNSSQDYTKEGDLIRCGYVFDEVRIPVPKGVSAVKAQAVLTNILHQHDEHIVELAKDAFSKESPNFLEETVRNPRVMTFVDASSVWLIGRIVAPVRGRNGLRSTIVLGFLEAMEREKSDGDAKNEKCVEVISKG